MTINKAQGQTIPVVGMYLPEEYSWMVSSTWRYLAPGKEQR
jgi:ATP-dependent exoDNAse (exonuclease V) alpha subunit